MDKLEEKLKIYEKQCIEKEDSSKKYELKTQEILKMLKN